MPAPTASIMLIAQTGSMQSGLAALVWTGVVIALIVGAVLFLKWMRGRLHASSRAPLVAAGSALEELRALREAGTLTQAEFEVARARLIARASARVSADRAVTAQSGAQGTPLAGPGMPPPPVK